MYQVLNNFVVKSKKYIIVLFYSYLRCDGLHPIPAHDVAVL